MTLKEFIVIWNAIKQPENYIKPANSCWGCEIHQLGDFQISLMDEGYTQVIYNIRTHEQWHRKFDDTIVHYNERVAINGI